MHTGERKLKGLKLRGAKTEGRRNLKGLRYLQLLVTAIRKLCTTNSTSLPITENF